MRPELSRLCIHSVTHRPWKLEQALDHFCQEGIKGISLWREPVLECGINEAARLLSNYPIELVSYVRGGFFASTSSTLRAEAIDHNIRLIEEAAILKAPLLVLVCGADPGQSLQTSRDQIIKGLEAILPRAEELRIGLGIEPLHPMYADERSAINTMKQANDMVELFSNPWLGVVVDAYHLWWDDQLKSEILRCGQNGHLMAYHVSDWKLNMKDMLNDRGLMGEGCIPLMEIRNWVEEAGFRGFIEVEIFSTTYWKLDQKAYLREIINAYLKHA